MSNVKTLTFSYTPEDIYLYNKYIFEKSKTRFIFIILGLFIIYALLQTKTDITWTMLSQPEQLSLLLPGIIIALVLNGFLLVLALGLIFYPQTILKFRTYRRIKTNPFFQGDRTLVFNKDNFELITPTAKTTFKWSSLTQIIKTPQFIALNLYGEKHGILIPRKSVSSEPEWQALYDYFEKRLQK